MTFCPQGTVLHIHAPKGTYHPQTRDRGCRKWEPVNTLAYTDKKLAAQRAVEAMIDRGAARARVLFCADPYDPLVVMEASV